MAIYVRCDGCKAEAEQSDAKWWHVSATKKETHVTQVTTFDLCNDCWLAAESAIFNPRNKITELSPREVKSLQEIWRNATSFDQSIGDIKPTGTE